MSHVVDALEASFAVGGIVVAHRTFAGEESEGESEIDGIDLN